MDYKTEFLGDNVIQVSSDDPDVLEQLEQHPAAVLVERDGGHAKFRIPLREFELHFPSGT